MKPSHIAVLLMLLPALWGCKTPSPPALGEPLAELTPDQRAQFEEGKQVFDRVFVPEDGLGPLFNANSCAACHESPARGGFGDEVEIHATRFDGPGSCDPLFQEGGPVIQQQATPQLKAKGIDKEKIPPSATGQGRRSTPGLFGLGLVDAVDDETILARERANLANSHGIRGHANRTIDGRVGRFGRKAAVATLFEFNAGAFNQEMGITTSLSPVEGTINGTTIPAGSDPAPDPEIGLGEIEKATTFVRFLAPPPPLTLTNREDHRLASRGRQLFAALECSACHVPALQTGTNSVQALNRRIVALYSDLLVHDMGPLLADICLGQARPEEFRTEMLMGLRFRTQFLHDGSAKTPREAIERHDGEGKYSSDTFRALSDYDKKALLKFLETL